MVSERASIGLKAGVRGGDLPQVGAQNLTVVGGAGAAFRLLLPDDAGSVPLGLAARVDVMLLYHAVSHQDSTGETQWRGHALPGAAVGLEATWRLARSLDLVLGGALEVAFGTVDVTVVAAPPGGGTVTIPAARAAAEAGVRVRF
jgi:hypothetical protein